MMTIDDTCGSVGDVNITDFPTNRTGL